MSTTLAPNRPLTQKQESFCLFIFQGLSQRDAYLKAGYSGKQGLESIDVHSSNLANDARIVLRIAQLRQKAEDAAIGTVQERQKRLTEIYRANLTDFVSEDGSITLKPSAALAELTVEEYVVDQEASLSRRTKRLKLRDPVAAIAEHNRMERIGQPDTIINNNNDNRSITIIVKSEEGKQAIQRLTSGKLPELQGGVE